MSAGTSSAATPTEQLRSTRRPVPLRGRTDLIVRQIEFRGVTHFAVKDPVGLTYHNLRCDQYRTLQLLDGERHLESIRDDLVREFPAIAPTLPETQQLIADLHQKGLAYSVRPGQASARLEQQRKTRRQKIQSVLMNFLSLRLPGWDPDRTLGRLLVWTRWMYHPVTAILATLLVISSGLLLATHFHEFQSRLPAFKQFFGWPNLIFLWMTLAGAKILHEFGHGLSCKACGCECHEMGVMLLVGVPCLYCDVSDSWMLRNKWQRILIGAAGMLVETVLSSIALFVWWFTEPGLLHYLSLNLFFVSSVTTVIFNANPLMRLDGYYMLSDFLEIPNLRQKSDQLVKDGISQVCLGVEPRPNPFMPQTGKPWFVLFAIASTIYGWVVLFGIIGFLYTVLKPHGLQSIGQTLAIASAAGVVVRIGNSTRQVLMAPRRDPIRKGRVALTLGVIAAVLILLGTIPVPWYGSAPFVIEPRDVQHVYTSVAGELLSVHVKPGDRVKSGTLLAELSDPTLIEKRQKLLTQRELNLQQIHVARAKDDPGARSIAESGLSSVEEQLRDLDERAKHLRVVAPCDGTVIAPPRRLPPKLTEQRVRLSNWAGTPLDPANAGAFLDERTLLLSIAPTHAMQAVLYLDQVDRHDVHVGLDVGLKFDDLPGQVFRSKITEVGNAHADTIPESLSVKYGGRLPTQTNREGKERLDDSAYQATVPLEATDDLTTSNLRGEARFVTARRTPFQWLWRFTRRTLHFRT